MPQQFLFRQPVNTEDSPEPEEPQKPEDQAKWEPPEYAQPKEVTKVDKTWKPPDYAKVTSAKPIKTEREKAKESATFGSNVKNLIDYTKDTAVGRFASGLAAPISSMYEGVRQTGKTAAEQVRSGDIHGAFQTVTKPLMGPIDQVNNMLEAAATGKKTELPTKPEAKHEIASQVAGMAGLNWDEVSNAYKEGNYAKLAGMGLTTAAITGLAHYVGEAKPSAGRFEDLPTRPIATRPIGPTRPQSRALPEPSFIPLGPSSLEHPPLSEARPSEAAVQAPPSRRIGFNPFEGKTNIKPSSELKVGEEDPLAKYGFTDENTPPAIADDMKKLAGGEISLHEFESRASGKMRNFGEFLKTGGPGDKLTSDALYRESLDKQSRLESGGLPKIGVSGLKTGEIDPALAKYGFKMEDIPPAIYDDMRALETDKIPLREFESRLLDKLGPREAGKFIGVNTPGDKFVAEAGYRQMRGASEERVSPEHIVSHLEDTDQINELMKKYLPSKEAFEIPPEMRDEIQKLPKEFLTEAGKIFDKIRNGYDNKFTGVTTPGGKELKFYDAGAKYTPQEFGKVMHSPHIQALGDQLYDIFGKMGDNPNLEKVGMFLTSRNRGITIPRPPEDLFSAVTRSVANMPPEKAAVMINPLQIMAQHPPDKAAAGFVHAALHELTHLQELKHNERFAVLLANSYEKFGADNAIAAQRKFIDTVAPSGQYLPEIQEILSDYKRSRWRPATQEDPFSRADTLKGTPGGGSEGLTRSSAEGTEGTSSSLESLYPPELGLRDVWGAVKSAFGGKTTTEPDKPQAQPQPQARLPKPPNKRPPVQQTVNSLFDALSQARGKREEQESMYTAERAKRFSAFARTPGEGEDWARKALSKMRGEYEKVEPGSALRLSSDQVNSLFSEIKHANITPAEQTRGIVGLYKILNGEGVPTRSDLAVLDDVFGGGFGSKITELHGGLGAVGLNIAKAGNTMKTLENMLNLAAPLRHGIGMLARPEFRPAFRDMFKFFANKDFYDKTNEAMEQHPKYLAAREDGLFLPKPTSGADEEFLDSYIGNFPKWTGVPMAAAASKRAYSGFLNKLKFDTYKDMTEDAEKLGYKMTRVVSKMDEDGEPQKVVIPGGKESRGIANFINTFTGRGDLGRLNKATRELNLLLWSPRMLASRLQMFTSPKLYMDLPKEMRTEGLKSLLAIASLGTVINGAGYAAGAKVSNNILSTDFMKSRFGTHVIDPWGGFQQFVVAASRFIAGKTDSSIPTSRLEIAGRFLANKESPLASFAHSMLTAKKFTGEATKVRPNLFGQVDPTAAGSYTDEYGRATSIQRELLQRFMPIFEQDLTNIAATDPDWSSKIGLSAAMGLASAAGMAQNYPEKRTGKLKLSSRKLTAR